MNEIGNSAIKKGMFDSRKWFFPRYLKPQGSQVGITLQYLWFAYIEFGTSRGALLHTSINVEPFQGESLFYLNRKNVIVRWSYETTILVVLVLKMMFLSRRGDTYSVFNFNNF